MRPRWVIAILTASTLASTAWAATISITGVDNNGSGGVYQIDGQNYWWMCVEPDSPKNVGTAETITADALSVLEGWDQQNTERLNIYQTDPTLYTTAIPKQIAVMEYVLDTYLPWDTLAGASGRFAEQNSNAANYANDDAFYNSFFAVQNFLAETYGKAVKTDFTNMSDFMNYYSSGSSASDIARSNIFQSILSDVAAKDGASFFDTYTAQHGYLIANTFLPTADPNNYQDALIISSFAPVPEPGSALLIACCGIAVMLRRKRLLK
ncbi:MAG: PEP-CTERM sorting domain-containing protein [Verrucomicrobiaceae bacterium]